MAGIHTRSRFKSIVNTVRRKAQAECNAAADDGVQEIGLEMDTASRFRTDRGSAKASVYAIKHGPGGGRNSGYAKASDAFLLALMSSRAGKNGIQQQHVEYAAERLLQEDVRPLPNGVAGATTATASKVMVWWEFGHDNPVTWEFEYEPRFEPMRQRARITFPYRFEGLLKKSFHQGG